MSSEIKATNYKAKDGTAGLVITDYSGDVKSTAKFGVRKTAVASLDVKSNADNANDGGISIEANSNTNRLFQLGETTGQTAIQQMYTGNTEKIRLHTNGDSYFTGGQVGVGTDSPDCTLVVSGAWGGSGNFFKIISTGTVLYRQMYFTDTHLYFWNGSNNPYLSGTGSWTNASDITIKKDIEDIHYGLETVNALKPRRYKHKACNTEDIGFVAQEVEGIVPEVVTGGADAQTGKGLSYGNLTAVLTKAIQELSAKVTALENA